MITLIKFLLRGLLKTMYRVEVSGFEHYHAAGRRALIVANHTSLLDGVLLYAWLPDTPTFAINTQIAGKKRFRFFLRFVDLFVMDNLSPLSVKSMVKFLREDKKAVIFPEGRITTTGSLMKIYEGPGLIADRAKAMVLPVAIDGAQFSPLSYLQKRGRIVWFPRIKLTMLPPRHLMVDGEERGRRRREFAARKMRDIMYELNYSSFEHRTSIFNAVARAAARHGKSTPIIEDLQRQALTYRQLMIKAMALGEVMRRDTRPGEHLGVMLPNAAATVVTFLAAQYAGRVAAMLNFTASRQALLLNCRTGMIKRVYTSRKFIERAGLETLARALEEKLSVVYLEDVAAAISLPAKLMAALRSFYPGARHRRVAGAIDPDDAAMILFTSGSERAPKGVVLSHSNALANYAQVSSYINFTPHDLVFSCLPMFHTFGLNAGCLMPLFGGSRIFLYPTPLHYRQIPEMIYGLGATILFGSDTFFKNYARYANPYDFHTLRYAVAGAEKLCDETVQTWMDKFGIRIYQGYGVTETSPVLSVNTPMECKRGSVGRLMTQVRHYLEPVAGIEDGGALCVQGPNIMLGYLLSDKPGVLQPPVTGRGRGWHNTGDVVRIDAEGYLQILGRAKRFAKIAGEMVSLTVVEEVAMTVWPGINHAAVSLPDDRKGEKIVLLTEHKKARRDAFRAQIKREEGSELQLPRHIFHVENLPVLGTGKTDYVTLGRIALELLNDAKDD